MVALRLMQNYEIRNVLLDYRRMAVCLRAAPALCGLTPCPRHLAQQEPRVAQIYVSTDSRTHGSTYNSYVLAMMEKYGSPDKLETSPSRNGVNESPGDNLRWSKNGQYIEANGIKRSVTVGSDSLDAKMDELRKRQHI